MSGVLTSKRLIPIIAAIFALKCLLQIAFSFHEVAYDALNSDFAIFYQCWALLVEGHLNPYSTIVGQPFWKDHFATAMWPLGLFGFISHSQVVLKIVQDVASAAADYVGALWTIAILRRATWLTPLTAVVLLVAAVVSLVANPWTYYTDAFDFHFYTISELCLVASLYAFYRGRRVQGLLFALGVSTGGDVNATYAVGLGASVILANRALWKEGLLIFAGSIAIVVGMHAAGAGTGSGLTGGYGYLITSDPNSSLGVLAIAKGIFSHPMTVLQQLWFNRVRIYANLGPSGWIGYLCPWTIGPWSVLLLENMLYHGLGGVVQSRFSLPGFQFGVGYASLPPATTWVLVWLAKRLRTQRIVVALGSLVALNAIGWGAAWLPSLETTFVRIPLGLAHEVYRLGAETPDDVLVLASQGVVGGISDRSAVSQYFGLFGYVMYRPHVRFILTPYSGTEVATVEQSADLIKELLDDQRAHLLRASNLLWVFDYDRGPHKTMLKLGRPHGDLPAAAFPTEIGTRILRTNSRDTSLEVNGDNAEAGYLLKQAYFRRPPGPYKVALQLRADTPVIIEVRDASKDRPILSHRFTGASLQRVEIPVFLAFDGGENLYDGFGPFISPAWQSSPYDFIEIRVWATAHARAEVRNVGVTPTYVELR